MRTLGNIMWVVLSGFWLAVGYAIAGLLMFLLLVTIPLGIQAFKLAGSALWPFGRAVVNKPGWGAASSGLLNIIWLVLAAWWLALGHVLTGALLCVTIIGIPFGIANFKLATLALWPFGKVVVPASTAGPHAFVMPSR